MSPAQAGKPRKITVRRNPFGARFDRQGGKIGVANQIAFGVRCLAQSAENFPMALARGYHHATRVSAKGVYIAQRFIERCGLLKNLRVSEYPHHSAQNDIRHTEVRNGLQSRAEPLSKFSVARKI